MRSKSLLLFIFQLVFLYSLVNTSYIGYATDEEIVDNQPERVWVNTVGSRNGGYYPYLHLFDSYNAKMLLTLDSPTYNFSSYFDNESTMTDKEVVRYSTNGVSFKSKGVMKPVYIAKWNNKWNHAVMISGLEQEIALWGYFSSVCIPDMVAVCLSGVTQMFYVPSLTRNHQLSCHDYNTRFGDQEWADYTSKYCNFAAGDKWAGFTYYRINEKFAMMDVQVLEKTEYQEAPKVMKKFQNTSPNEVSYSYENTIESGNVRINRESMSHEWSVKVSAEKTIGNDATPAKTTINVEVGYVGSETKELETQSTITTTSTENLSFTLKPNTSVILKQTAAFEKQKIRAQICYPTRSITKPWFGCSGLKVGHYTTKSLNLQQTGTGTTGVPHIIYGQLCFLGELNLETNSYVSLLME